jgi:hypothetical protein
MSEEEVLRQNVVRLEIKEEENWTIKTEVLQKN